VKGSQSGESCVRFTSDGAKVTWSLPSIHIRGEGRVPRGGGGAACTKARNLYCTGLRMAIVADTCHPLVVC
jgi:hypothetical protein